MKEIQAFNIVGQIDRRSVAKLTPELRKKIEKVYQEFSQKKGFPYDCGIASPLLSVRLGLQMVKGYFRVDGPLNELPHVWTKDAGGQIVDFTAAQFNPYLEKHVPNGILIVQPGEPLYERYRVVSEYPTAPKILSLKNLLLALRWKKEH